MSKASKTKTTGTRNGVIIGVVIAAVLLVVGVVVWQLMQGPMVRLKSPAELERLAETLECEDCKIEIVNPAGEATGNLAEIVNGDEAAPVKVFAYLDYMVAPDYNAAVNTILNQIVDVYDGEVAVVTRGYVATGEEESVTVAAAVEAAAIQGYGQAYINLLHEDNERWSKLEGRELQKELEEIFMQASENKGDREQFRKDMGSDEVMQKLVFNQAMADRTDRGNVVTVFFVNDEKLAEEGDGEFARLMTNLIDKKLAETKQE